MAIGGVNYGNLRQRNGTVASLAAANPVLSFGEFTMTYSGTTPILKIGDGVRTWTALPNLVGGGGGGGGLVLVQPDAPAEVQGQLWFDTDATV